MALTNYLEGELLRHVFRGETYTPPAALYLALFTSAPDASGQGGTEVTGQGYVRVAVTFDVTEGNPSVASLNKIIEFPTAETDWGLITTMVIFDDPTAGNALSMSPFTDPNNPDQPLPKDTTTGDIVRVVQNNLELYLGTATEVEAT